MEVAGWAGEGEEDGRVKLQKRVSQKEYAEHRDKHGGNAPAPLGQTKLPSYSVSVWVWTSGPAWIVLVCVCVCALAVLVSPGCCSASREVSWPPFTLPYGGVCYCNCNQSWKALCCRVGPGPPNNSSLSAKQKKHASSKQSKQPRLVSVWLEFGPEISKSQQNRNHVLKRHRP